MLGTDICNVQLKSLVGDVSEGNVYTHNLAMEGSVDASNVQESPPKAEQKY